MSAPVQGSPAIPMTMDEWNRRMRKEKEKERQKKTESAEILKTYRGGLKEDDMKLAALRKEGWQKKQDAERLLHSYKNKNTPEAKQRPVAQQQTFPPPVKPNQQDDPYSSIAVGSVSAMAGKFASQPERNTTVNTMKKQISVQEQMQQRSMEESTAMNQPAKENDVPVPVPLPVAEENSTPYPVINGRDRAKRDNDTAKELAGPMSYLLVEEKKTETEPAEEPMLAEDQPLHGHMTLVRLDVLFSFGLVTSRSEPALDGYMEAVEKVLITTLEENDKLAEYASYDAEFPPFVKEYEFDDSWVDPSGRSHVKRAVVVAAVPVFLKNGIAIGEARDGVVAGLQQAIESGKFVKLARANIAYF